MYNIRIEKEAEEMENYSTPKEDFVQFLPDVFALAEKMEELQLTTLHLRDIMRA